jgi:hypothetical protein
VAGVQVNANGFQGLRMFDVVKVVEVDTEPPAKDTVMMLDASKIERVAVIKDTE